MGHSLGLVDAWLELRPTSTAAHGVTRWNTAHGRRTSGTRIDRDLLPPRLLKGANGAALPTLPEVVTGLSDHHALVVHVASPRLVDIGAGLWRMPCSLPGVEEYRLAQALRVKEFVFKAASLPDPNWSEPTWRSKRTLGVSRPRSRKISNEYAKPDRPNYRR